MLIILWYWKSMQFEKVHTVNEYYDHARSGTADFGGTAHYFPCLFDHAADEYSEHYQLYPVTTEFMERQLQSWAIWKAWEVKFHNGLAPLSTNPANRGMVPEYDELGDWISQQVRVLEPLATRFTAVFRAREGQDQRLRGPQREFEVAWSSVVA